MLCSCGAPSDIIESRTVAKNTSTRRRRKCRECGLRWSTYEVRANADLESIRSALDEARRQTSDDAERCRRRLAAVESELANLADAMPRFESPRVFATPKGA